MTLTEPRSAAADGPTPGGAPVGADGMRGAGAAAGERGLTEIADRVVEKLAVRLAGEVDGVAPDQPVGGLRGALPGVGSAGFDAHAEAGRRTARVSLTIDVRYPEPAAEVSDRVREHVIAGVRRLTGLEVDSLTITVRRLLVGRAGRRRVV